MAMSDNTPAVPRVVWLSRIDSLAVERDSKWYALMRGLYEIDEPGGVELRPVGEVPHARKLNALADDMERVLALTEDQPGAEEMREARRLVKEASSTAAMLARPVAVSSDTVRPDDEQASPSERCDVYVRTRNVMRADLRTQQVTDDVMVDWWTDRDGVEHVCGVEVLDARGVEVNGLDVVKGRPHGTGPEWRPSPDSEAEQPRVPCPDCGDDPDDPESHADGCPRIGTDVRYQCGPPWNPLPGQVETQAAEPEHASCAWCEVTVTRRPAGAWFHDRPHTLNTGPHTPEPERGGRG